jgi:ribose transport system permease protein
MGNGVEQRRAVGFDLQKLVLLGILFVVVAVFRLLTDRFLTGTNLINISKQVAFVIITGSAITLLMISGHLDLSVGSAVALTGVTYAYFCKAGVPLGYSLVIGIACGALLGLINAVTVVKLKITPLIATLGMLYMARGLALLIAEGKTIRYGLPEGFIFLGRGNIGLLPVPLIVTVVVVVAFSFIQQKHLLGKYSFAIGGNRTAAVLSGVKADSIVAILYIIVGVLAGVSGVMMASRLGVGEPNVAIGFEFDVIIAVILGGTSLAGGEGSILGMVIGALIVACIDDGLNLLNVLVFYQSVVKGVVLVFALLLDRKIKDILRSLKSR